MVVPLKSRFKELYPAHDCPQCGLDHSYIPNISVMRQGEPGQPKVKLALAPLEILGVITGAGRPGVGTLFNTPATVIGLIWGIPGSGDVLYNRVLYMN